jgi:hypothetical protein
MKFHTGLVFAACLSLGLISYACVNGDTVQNGATGNGGSPSGDTGGSSSGNTGGNGSGTGGSNSHTGGNNGTGGSGTGGSSSHTGGSNGTGGIVGTGGSNTGNTTGTGGTSSSGTGGTGSTATSCVDGETNPPSMKLITDFSDAVASSGGNYNFGSSAGQLGGTSTFISTGSMATLSTGTGGLTFKGTVAAPTTANMYPYSGVTVFINGPGCVNASAYTGVSFTISGSVGTCNVVFAFGDKEHTTAASDPMRGTCTASSCYAGQYSLTVSGTATTVKMPFATAPTSMGSPATAVDTMNLTGVQFQLGQATTATSTCMATLTITNISFY